MVKTLVYIIPGYRSTAQSMRDVIETAKDCYPDSDVICPTLAIRSNFKFKRATQTLVEQIDAIDRLYQENNYEEIIIVGYSIGALIAQRILIEAGGVDARWTDKEDQQENPFASMLEPRLNGVDLKRDWARKVKRLVLIAGMTKGWSTDITENRVQIWLWRMGALGCHLVPFFKPSIFDYRRGGPFVVQTRLRGLKFEPAPDQDLQIVQLVGSTDGLVSPTHSLDMLSDEISSTFKLVEVPYSNHRNIKWFSAGAHKTSKRQRAQLAKRREIVAAALCGNDAVLSAHEITRNDLTDELTTPHCEDTKDIVFVIHGIRDRGYWTKKIGARIKRVALKAGKKFATRTPSYGYFPILPFLLPWYRLGKVEWLMDQYADVKAAYPDATMHYMGHSNGTYLCARGLRDYPAVRFQHIMFAGSVVHPNFPWIKLMDAGRVDKVFNAPATADIVVAFFPHALRWFSWFFDLGGAGHVGFRNDQNDPRLFQLDRRGETPDHMRFMIGNHKSAREETHWDEIAEFIVNGTPPDIDNEDYAEKQSLMTRGLAGAGTVVFPLFLIAAIGFFLFSFGEALARTETKAGWFNSGMDLLGMTIQSPLLLADLLFSNVSFIDGLTSKIGSFWRDLSTGATWLFFVLFAWLLRTLTLRF